MVRSIKKTMPADINFLAQGHTLLIQGKLNPQILKTVRVNHELFDEIIISFWEGENQTSFAEEGRINRFPNVKWVCSTSLDLASSHAPKMLRLQSQTTLAGLRQVKTRTVTKMRSDEFFDLRRWVAELSMQTDKILFSNFICRPWGYHKFHISDHLFGGPTLPILSAFTRLVDSGGKGFKKLLSEKDFETPESVLGAEIYWAIRESYLNAESIEFHPNRSEGEWDFFKRSFMLFDIELLENFSVNANRAGVRDITSIKRLGSVFESSGASIDFSYYRKISSLRPLPNWIHKLGSRYRYIARKLVTRLYDSRFYRG